MIKKKKVLKLSITLKKKYHEPKQSEGDSTD